MRAKSELLIKNAPKPCAAFCCARSSMNVDTSRLLRYRAWTEDTRVRNKGKVRVRNPVMRHDVGAMTRATVTYLQLILKVLYTEVVVKLQRRQIAG